MRENSQGFFSQKENLKVFIAFVFLFKVGLQGNLISSQLLLLLLK